MIYLRLAGGLGNQLYQIAAASLLAQRTLEIVTPLTEGLKKYDVPREPDSIKILRPNNWLQTSKTIESAIMRRVALNARAGRWMPIVGINDKTFWEAVKRKRFNLPRILDGYFQTGWAHSTFETALSGMAVNDISPKAAARIDTNEVVVHIRGGDFLKLPYFQVVNSSYYILTARLAMRQGFKNFAVLTDDLSYADIICQHISHTLPAIKLRVLTKKESNVLDDFDTLRHASARIIGNSTFAWWAAALGKASSITWSPTRLTINTPKDFFLSNEIPITETVYS